MIVDISMVEEERDTLVLALERAQKWQELQEDPDYEEIRRFRMLRQQLLRLKEQEQLEGSPMVIRRVANASRSDAAKNYIEGENPIYGILSGVWTRIG